MERKIKDIDSLDNEIQRLQVKAGNLEERLNDNFEYLQENYSSMIMSSVFSNTGTVKNSIAGTVAGYVLGNEKLQEVISRFVNHLVDKAATGLDKLADRVMGKEG